MIKEDFHKYLGSFRIVYFYFYEYVIMIYMLQLPKSHKQG